MYHLPEASREPTDDRQRVLVVDDEPTLRLGFAYALSSKTSMVETAINGCNALEKIALTRFDIIILDLRMPEMDGLTVIESLRREGNRIPIVLCSAALHGAAALRAVQHGVVDFLVKPVLPIELRGVIEFVLRPEKSHFPLAMKAARSGDTIEAIRLLQGAPTLNPQMSLWLQLFTAMRDAHPDLSGKFGTGLPVLAFNSTSRS
jgi:DNA-binding response OmpR family regulator